MSETASGQVNSRTGKNTRHRALSDLLLDGYMNIHHDEKEIVSSSRPD
jgi:hypothetical protein